MGSETHIIYSRAEKATSPALPKFRIVKAASGKVSVTTGVGSVPYGISMGATTATTLSNREVQIALIGVAPVEASSTQTVTHGLRIVGGAAGKAVAAAGNGLVAGIALTTAAAGEVFPILIQPCNRTSL